VVVRFIKEFNVARRAGVPDVGGPRTEVVPWAKMGDTQPRREAMANILCVLYDDPVDGYPPPYARDGIPAIERYYDGQATPTPEAVDFTPGELLGSVSGELGLRTFLEERAHRLIVTADKDGPDSEFERELPDADIVISQPFWPAYLTAERFEKAPKLKLAVTAGIGSDHVDLQAAIDRGVTVTEVTYCNSISVAEHVVMLILALVRNYLPSHQWVHEGGWNIADCVARSYDLEGMQVGTVGAGRIGSAVLRRLKPFEVGLHYTDRHRLPADVEEELGVTFHETPESLVRVCDVVTINAPLHPETEHLFDAELIGRMKRGAYLVNTARGKICDRDAVARACESGQLAAYAGDVWFPQPAPVDHPWRTMPNHGMTPHVSGTSLSAQARYAAGVREILECWFDDRPIREEYLIVDGGRLAGAGAHSYSAGDATRGSEEATRFSAERR
jgi:formate dehydrogenase